MHQMTSKLPKPFDLNKLAQRLFYANAAIWVIFGIITFTRMSTAGFVDQAVAGLIALLMFGNAGAMLVAGLGLRTSRRLFYFFGILVLVVNIILTFTDQVGLLDIVTVVIDLALLGILIAIRSQFRMAK